jgi:hypothetical protein
MTNLQHHKANGAVKPSEFEVELAELKLRMSQLEAAIGAQSGEVEQSFSEVEQLPEAEKKERRGRPHLFHKITRGDDLYRIYQNKDQRTRILNAITNKKAGRDDLLALILQSIDGGLLVENDICVRSTLTLRTIFPWLPSHCGFATRYNLEQQRCRDEIRADILPIVIAHKAAVMADPNILSTLVYNEKQRRARAEQEVRAIESLKKGESHIVVFGQTVWPRVNARSGSYSYEEICCAARMIRDADDNLKGEPKSRAIHIRNSTKWLRRHCASIITKDPDAKASIERVYSLVHWLASFLEESPKGECRWPATIHME